MSTAATTHHRISDPIAMAAAVVVIIGGAAVIGVAASQSETATPTAPAPPVHGKVTPNNPGAGTGLGDFNDFVHQNQGGSQSVPPTGGHSMVSEP